MHRLWLVLGLSFLLSGCVVEEDPDGDGPTTPTPTTTSRPPGFAPQQGTEHGEAAGIELDVTWRACEAGFCANATATNRGTSTVQISSICESPWEDDMSRGGANVEHRPPQYTCLAFGREPFAPGDFRQTNFTWDGQVHVDEEPQDAPPGEYVWTLRFWWDDGEGGGRDAVMVHLNLVVGET